MGISNMIVNVLRILQLLCYFDRHGNKKLVCLHYLIQNNCTGLEILRILIIDSHISQDSSVLRILHSAAILCTFRKAFVDLLCISCCSV